MDIIFDIDGTLTDAAHRRHLVSGPGEKNWPRFLDLAGEDAPRVEMIRLASMLHSAGARLILDSGRYERYRAMTVSWFLHHAGPWLAERPLFMRADGDSRSDDIIKPEMLAAMRAQGFMPSMAIDDRDRVVKAWRAAGLVCLQSAEGDF
jgi:hypothetical protein